MTCGWGCTGCGCRANWPRSAAAGRSWFRYHHLFADLLQLELRRTEPDEVALLHRTASDWFAEHGHPVEAVRHAQAAGDWTPAARLLADHWSGLYLDGQEPVIHELLAGFPAQARAADAELAALTAGDELAHGSLGAAERYLALAERASVPAARHGPAQTLRGIVRLLLARQRGDLATVRDEVRRLQEIAETPDAAQPARGDDLRALTLITLGIAEMWAGQIEDAQPHLEQGVATAFGTGSGSVAGWAGRCVVRSRHCRRRQATATPC